MKNNFGKLIVIDGLDGSGKKTQTDMVYEHLKANGKKVKEISFPDYKEKSSTLIKMYLDGEFGKNPEDVNAYAASSFFAMDRYASYIKHWKRDYEQGTLILSDRYSTSNIIYHMSKLDQKEWKDYIDWLEDYEYNKIGIPKPDVVIYLDVDINISQRLLSERYDGEESRKDIHEKNIDFIRKCRECAMFASDKLNWEIINCMNGNALRSKEDINKEIISIIQ